MARRSSTAARQASAPVRAGSHVRHGGPGSATKCTVKALSANKLTTALFYDARDEEYYLDDVPVGELTHLPQTIALLSVDGAATSFTRFGVDIASNRKQLWLRDNRAYETHDKEPTRLRELSDVIADTYDDANAGRGAMGSGEDAGNGITVRMCES